MTCEQALDNLLDLVYGELDASRAAAVREHLATCESCRTEFDQLTRARAALAATRDAEPKRDAGILPARGDEDGLTFHSDQAHGAHNAGETPAPRSTGVPPVSRMGETPMLRAEPASARRPRTLRLRIARLAAAAAAVVVAAVLVWTLLTTGPDSPNRPIEQTLYAAPMDEIVREGVSVTILSTPEEPSPRSGRYWVQPLWQGLSLVRDQRLSRSLRAGETTVALSDIPTGIVPGSVAIRPMRPADGFAVLEQNYQFDLASASALLAKCVGQPVTLTLKDETTVTGELLSRASGTAQMLVDGQQWTVPLTLEGNVTVGGTLISWSPGEVLLSVNGQPRLVPLEAVTAMRTARMPEGLLVKPTLVWKLTSDAVQENLPLEVAYLTSGLSWRADYTLTLAPGMLAELGKGGLPEILDTAGLVGYATVTNRSGTTFQDAQLKLMAGDVNLVREDYEIDVIFSNGRLDKDMLFEEDSKSNGFVEQSFFEYHLYTLGRPTTLRDQETKQIELVTGSGMKMKRAYVYDPHIRAATNKAPQVVSELKNTKANGLGVPLPKGVVRLYVPDEDGVNTFVAQTSIDHTPVNEKLRLPWGFAFDIVCDSLEIRTDRDGPECADTWRFSLHNAKPYDVTVTCVARVPAMTYAFSVNGPYKWRQREVGIVEFDVPLAAGEAVEVEWTRRFNIEKSGGLVSPADEEGE